MGMFEFSCIILLVLFRCAKYCSGRVIINSRNICGIQMDINIRNVSDI